MPLAFGDPNSKLLDVVGVVDVNSEEGVDDSLIEMFKLKFGQDFEAECRLRLKFSGVFEAALW